MQPDLIKTKAQALGALHTITNNFVLGLVFIAHSPEINWARIGEGNFTARANYREIKFSLTPLFGGVTNLGEQRPKLVQEFLGMLRRAGLAEAHEAVVAYCEATNQFPTYRSQPWFQFARILRNATSHKQGGIITWPIDLKKSGVQSVSWRYLTITSAMDGKEIEMADNDTLEYLGSMIEFVKNDLR